MTEPVFYQVADLVQPSPEPFAVIAIYPERREGTGCKATVVSLHAKREDAEREATRAALKGERCSMGVGCDEYGVCYADAHNAPLMCPLYAQKPTLRKE